MIRALTAAQMRQVEAAAVRAGTPVFELMERAGSALAEAALRLAGPQSCFWVCCGGGNNGGDGLVAARRLRKEGRKVWVSLTGPATALRGDAQTAFAAYAAAGGTPTALVPTGLGPGDVAIDALFGTGLSRPPEGAHAEAIQQLKAWRARGARVLAADLPSGLMSDSGFVFEPTVVADVTVAFGYPKVGQLLEPGASHCGELQIAGIGLQLEAPEGLEGGVFLVEAADAQRSLAKRSPTGHKGTYGHLLVVAGSPGKEGAAALCGMAALRAGSGLVTLCASSRVLRQAQRHAPELMGSSLPDDEPLGLNHLDALRKALEGKDGLVFGPGISRGPTTGALIRALLDQLSIPCLIDADGLNAIGTDVEMLASRKGPLILTPHPGEMARLLGLTTGVVGQDRIGAARQLAARAKAVAVLKGARTLIATPDGSVFINPTGNPGMATAGTGDVLSGFCGSLLGQGLSAEQAAITGCYVHGLAGDSAVRSSGQRGLLASDLLSGIQTVWVSWNR